MTGTLTDAERRIMRVVVALAQPPYGVARINARELTRELGVSVTTFGSALRKLRLAGKVRVLGRGQAGTLVEILDPGLRDALRP